ncbi:hypothetical protein [Deinococcus arenicola]|uniref:Transposase n=1 Tax=Deinococcus arenicola TaxID=2994950 RepID=A0ABU4DTG1_9DEIO|nr:hypothetical protein [Deinococcus sp. ZS9-10]MDV6375726.1 hypothetical protein [Deinococcus sp. ZS9-10]
MSPTSELLILSRRAAQVWHSLREFWGTCLETASLFRQGVTPPMLVVWASLLTVVTVHALNSH